MKNVFTPRNWDLSRDNLTQFSFVRAGKTNQSFSENFNAFTEFEKTSNLILNLVTCVRIPLGWEKNQKRIISKMIIGVLLN